MLIYEVGVRQIIDVIAPQVFGDRLTGEHAVLVDHEIQQQLKFFGREVERLSVNECLHRVRIDGNVVYRNGSLTVEVASTKYGAQPRVQFRKVEGFREVVVGTQVQPLDPVVQGVLCRYDQNTRLHPLCLHELDQLQAVAVGEHEIQNYAVILEGNNLVTRLVYGVTRFADVAFPAQERFHVPGQLQVVFDEENFHQKAKLGQIPEGNLRVLGHETVSGRRETGGIDIFRYGQKIRRKSFCRNI